MKKTIRRKVQLASKATASKTQRNRQRANRINDKLALAAKGPEWNARQELLHFSTRNQRKALQGSFPGKHVRDIPLDRMKEILRPTA